MTIKVPDEFKLRPYRRFDEGLWMGCQDDIIYNYPRLTASMEIEIFNTGELQRAIIDQLVEWDKND